MEHFLVCFFFPLKHFYFLNLFVQITITLDTPHERVCVCDREIERIFIAYIIKKTDRTEKMDRTNMTDMADRIQNGRTGRTTMLQIVIHA